jgi:hypothetical protein|tara:strand:- start:637 stop:972 length:336 start_codon:yes stop_codon:yes gene_type:complete
MSERESTQSLDMVNNPTHYNAKGVECIDAIEASMSKDEFKGYLKGNVMKYMWRYDYKGKPVEDLKKAEWYLKKLIASVEEPCYNSSSVSSIDDKDYVDIVRGKIPLWKKQR